MGYWQLNGQTNESGERVGNQKSAFKANVPEVYIYSCSNNMSTMTVMTPKLVVFTIAVREPIAELYSDAASKNS